MIYLGILVAIFLQSSFISVPIILPIILTYFIFSKNTKAFFIAFISGILIDIFLLNPIGISSLYFSLALFLVFLYSRKFEIETLPFIGIFTFISSSIYIFIFSNNFLFLKTIICTILSILIYYSYLKIKKNNNSTSLVK